MLLYKLRNAVYLCVMTVLCIGEMYAFLAFCDVAELLEAPMVKVVLPYPKLSGII